MHSWRSSISGDGGRRSRAATVVALIALAVMAFGGPAAMAASALPSGTALAGSGLGVTAVAHGGAAGKSARRPLKITTKALANGIKGLSYLQVLSASGGVAPYTWTATGLPRGLTVSRLGVITGYPRVTGVRIVTLRVRDARHKSRRRRLRLRIPSALPAGCIARSCAKLSKDGHTLQIPVGDITSVTRNTTSGKVTSVSLSGVTVAPGDVLVLAPAAGIPSGLIAVADSVTAGTDGSSTVAVTPASPADAYHLGIVQAIGQPVTASPRHGLSVSRRANAAQGSRLSCNGNVTSDLHGLSVAPSLTPDLTAAWKHRRFGGKGFFPGSGGLSLFQFGLTGTITVNLGVSVSGKATCTLDLPSLDRPIPAGDLGVVLVQIDPSLTLKTTAAVDVRTSVTLTCTTEYRWDQGSSYRSGSCTESHQPLRLSAGSGVDATLTGTIDASASLDDLTGVKGSIDASLHAGYHPAAHPIAEIDAKADYELRFTLANIWSHAPSLRIAGGTLFDQVLATYDNRPPGTSRPSITVSPDEAYPFNATVCGFDNPTLPDTFTVTGRDFIPGESVTVSTGWKTYPGHPAVGANGRFSVTEFVGEVPSTDNTQYPVRASGRSGSRASSVIELNSDGCVYQTVSADGDVTAQWGGNGFDPDTSLSFSVDGNALSSASTDSNGTGGATAGFSCPSSGDYTWSVSGTDNGHPESAGGNLDCTPSADQSHTRHSTSQNEAASTTRT